MCQRDLAAHDDVQDDLEIEIVQGIDLLG